MSLRRRQENHHREPSPTKHCLDPSNLCNIDSNPTPSAAELRARTQSTRRHPSQPRPLFLRVDTAVPDGWAPQPGRRVSGTLSGGPRRQRLAALRPVPRGPIGSARGARSAGRGTNFGDNRHGEPRPRDIRRRGVGEHGACWQTCVLQSWEWDGGLLFWGPRVASCAVPPRASWAVAGGSGVVAGRLIPIGWVLDLYSPSCK